AVGSWFGNTFSAAWEAVKKVFANWGSFFSGLWDTIKNTFSKLGTAIADAIGGAVKAGINGVITIIENAVNGAIKLINGAIGLINKIPGVEIGKMKELSLPRLAKGGVVTRPTVAEIGENGAEVVMPLENNTKWIDLLANKITAAMDTSAAGGHTYSREVNNNLGGVNFNIENFVNNTEKDLQQLVEEGMEIAEEYMRRRGGAFA
ncbi:MAG: hypothetical protein IKA40_01020, partial [Clostridia bacterium]|nr:hypothetical protein [Clostridia bacterium]